MSKEARSAALLSIPRNDVNKQDAGRSKDKLFKRRGLEACTSLKTQSVYEIRLVHMNTRLCKFADGFAHAIA